MSRCRHASITLRACANAGVKECWLALGPEKQIEGHRQPQHVLDWLESKHTV